MELVPTPSDKYSVITGKLAERNGSAMSAAASAVFAFVSSSGSSSTFHKTSYPPDRASEVLGVIRLRDAHGNTLGRHPLIDLLTQGCGARGLGSGYM